MKKRPNPYHFLNDFCLRTPLLSLNFYKSVFNENEIGSVELKNLWQESNIKEALFLASPELYKQLAFYFDNERPKKERNDRLEQTFLKYIIRISSRCTPFGLFASITTGNFDTTTSINLRPINDFTRITKYDTHYLSVLLNYLSKNPIVKNQLLFYPNTTLYRIANQYRYVEYQERNKTRSYSVEAVEHTPYLEKLLSGTKNGKSIEALSNMLVDDDITIEDANDFVESLIENQLLVSEFELTVTGKDILVSILERLKELKNTDTIASNVKVLHNNIVEIDKKIGNTVTSYQNIFNVLTDIKIPFEEKYVFQVDLFSKTKSNTLDIKHAYALKKLMPLLSKLTPYTANKSLEQFKKAFAKRYESREMPLAKVLDIESGIGYIQNSAISNTTPFLEDINPESKKSKNETLNWTQVDSVIYAKLLDENGHYSIEIKDEDFDHLEGNWDSIPDTLSAFVEIVKTDNNEQLIVNGLSANAGNLLARFSHGDKTLLKHIKDITTIEQQIQSDKVLAEIVHVPEARTGNILKRPHIRAYEIPYMAKSTLDKSHQIGIDDLWISIENDTIVIKSKALGKDVLPRLTNAHNYSLRALPIYNFLCDLQYQNKNVYLGFSWPQTVKKHPFLPRVLYKNIILSKARWYLDKNRISTFLVCYDDSLLLKERINKWQQIYTVPKYVFLSEGDNNLLIDLDNIETIKLLVSTIKNKEHCMLEEFLFSDDTIVKRNEEVFTNEFIIALYNQEKLNAVSK